MENQLYLQENIQQDEVKVKILEQNKCLYCRRDASEQFCIECKARSEELSILTKTKYAFIGISIGACLHGVLALSGVEVSGYSLISLIFCSSTLFNFFK